jgi:hypothetical protein
VPFRTTNARPFLLDGFVAGFCRVADGKTEAVLEIETLAPLGAADRTALEEEGLRLLAFAAPEATSIGVRWVARV